MRGWTERNVSDGAFPFALRELQGISRRRGLWIGLFAVGAILGLAGPFGTGEVMRLLPRLAYWTGLAILTFLSGSFLSSLIAHWSKSRRGSPWGPVALTGVATGAIASLEVLLINWASFGLSPFTPGYALPLVLNVTVIACVVAGALHFHDQSAATEEQTPPILGRLPFDKRGSLIALSVSDHYVEVRTTKGRDMVLMRLSDAIRECAPEPGLQVHRSHWVARAAVTMARRDGARVVLELSDGSEAPVSRSCLPQVKEAGLLPG